MSLKSLVLCLVVVCVNWYSATAQDKPHLKIGVGLNIINNNPSSRMPWAIETLDYNWPVGLSVDYQVSKKWSFGISASSDKLTVTSTTLDLLAIHAQVNYYLFPNTARQFKELYLILGTGLYQVSDHWTTTINPGMGINYWVLPKLAINITGKANVAVKNSYPDVGSYYQCHIGVIWRFTDGF